MIPTTTHLPFTPERPYGRGPTVPRGFNIESGKRITRPRTGMEIAAYEAPPADDQSQFIRLQQEQLQKARSELRDFCHLVQLLGRDRLLESRAAELLAILNREGA